MRVANRAEGERLRKAKEDKKKKKQRKLRARERREDTDNDDDDDDGDDDEVMEEEETIADDIEWDNLENEDALDRCRFVLAGVGTLPVPWRRGHIWGADGGRPF